MTSPHSDDRLGSLMVAVQRGDSMAYRELLSTITPRIRRAIARRCIFSRPEDIEDVVQDILLSVHTARATYDPRRPFMPWLLAIVRHRVADGARRYRRTTGREIQVDDADVTFSDPTANHADDTADDVEALDRALCALPAGQRQAIELLKLRELSLKEAAALSGTTIGALKVAVHRAMTALREALRGRRERA